MTIAVPTPPAVWTVGCNPFTLYSQNASPTESNRPDANKSNNCGEAGAAMICEWITGVRFYPDTIWRIACATGHATAPDYEPPLGPSSNLQLEAFLRDICNIPTTQYDVAGQNDYEQWLYKYLYWQKPVLILRYGDHSGPNSPGETTRLFHWAVAYSMSGVGATVTGITVADPWTGQPIQEVPDLSYDWAAPSTINQKLLVGVDRSRSIDINMRLGR